MSDEMSMSEILATEADQVITDDVVETVEAQIEPAQDQPISEVIANDATPEVEQNDNGNSEIEAFKKAALDERRKRQDMQVQLDALKNPVEKPDAYANPDEAIQFANNSIEQKFTTRLLNMSESQARLRHSDFDAMQDVFFNELSVSNPSLNDQAMNAPDPYEFVYQHAKNHNEFKDIGSAADYEAKVRAKIMLEIESNKNAEKEKAANDAINAALPQTLSNNTAIGGNTQPAEHELNMSEIFNGR